MPSTFVEFSDARNAARLPSAWETRRPTPSGRKPTARSRSRARRRAPCRCRCGSPRGARVLGEPIDVDEVVRLAPQHLGPVPRLGDGLGAARLDAPAVQVPQVGAPQAGDRGRAGQHRPRSMSASPLPRSSREQRSSPSTSTALRPARRRMVEPQHARDAHRRPRDLLVLGGARDPRGEPLLDVVQWNAAQTARTARNTIAPTPVAMAATTARAIPHTWVAMMPVTRTAMPYAKVAERIASENESGPTSSPRAPQTSPASL